jgi:Fe-S-cluster containining protein
VAREIRLPDNARFSCQSCGRCCSGWTVTVDASRVEQLRRHDWGADPFVPLGGTSDAFRIKLVDGRCFFLDEDRRCRIHAELGYEAKPEGCKAFPLMLGEVAGETRARLSFYCPSVSENRGRPLQQQMRWVRATARAAGEIRRTAPLTLDGEIELSARELASIEGSLDRLLGREAVAIADRLAAGCAVLLELQQALSQQGKGALAAALRRSEQSEIETLATAGRAEGRAARAGPLLSLYLGPDGRPGKLARFGRFIAVRLFNLGLIALRSRAMGAKASWRQISAVRFEPNAESNALLTRFLLHKLRSRRIVAGELSLLSGFNLLVTAYGVINLLARLAAAADRRDHCQAAEITRAVQAADLLVIEHTTLHHGELFATLTESVLADRRLCAALLARLEV